MVIAAEFWVERIMQAFKRQLKYRTTSCPELTNTSRCAAGKGGTQHGKMPRTEASDSEDEAGDSDASGSDGSRGYDSHTD